MPKLNLHIRSDNGLSGVPMYQQGCLYPLKTLGIGQTTPNMFSLFGVFVKQLFKTPNIAQFLAPQTLPNMFGVAMFRSIQGMFESVQAFLMKINCEMPQT